MEFASSRIALFCKAPVAGTVKTRLTPALGEEGALRLHEQLLGETITRVSNAGLCSLHVAVAPDPTHEFFARWRGREYVGTIEFGNQRGTDLGARMRRTAEALLEVAEAVVLIGNDCPGVEAEYLREALSLLADGEDTVIGPAEDGGYVLLGIKRAAAELFADIDWGTARVYEQTARVLDRLGWRWRSLPPRWDVDRPEDLPRLKASDPAAWNWL